MAETEDFDRYADASIMAEIEEWVMHDSDPIRTLTNIACLIGNQFRCDACSVYLLDAASDLLVLAGTVGLRQECVGEIRMTRGEGLTGLVAQQRCPIVVRTSASKHPRFRYFPEAGEDLYDSFLGVPLLDGDTLLGVLVLQTFEHADFRESDVDRMRTAGEHLGPRIRPLINDTLLDLSSILSESA